MIFHWGCQKCIYIYIHHSRTSLLCSCSPRKKNILSKKSSQYNALYPYAEQILKIMHYFHDSHYIMQYRSSTNMKSRTHILFQPFPPSYISHLFTQTANNISTGTHFPSSTSNTMPETINGTQVAQYAGSAFHISPSASALPVPKTLLRPSSGSGVWFSPSRKQNIYSLDAITHVLQGQRDAEGPSDGDEAGPVTSDKSHEGKSAVSELVSVTKEQDQPVDDVVMLPFIQMFRSQPSSCPIN